MTDKCTYFVFVTRSQENLSSSFPFHDTKVHEILSTVLESFRIFHQQSSTGHVESEYISISQSTMSLFWQEYCNKKKENTVYLTNELRTWPRALHGHKDKVTYLKTIAQLLYSSLFISSIRFPVGDVPF